MVAAELGAIMFGAAGVALNLADMAEAKGLHAARIARPAPGGAPAGAAG